MRSKGWRALLAAGCWVGVLLVAGCGGGQVPTDVEVESVEGLPLGTLRFMTACDDAARDHLMRGLALLHHMTYLKAEAEFAAAVEQDPDCALGYWGQAMTYVHPLWPDVIRDEHYARGQELLAQAEGAGHSTNRDAAWIDALSAYYEGGLDASERERLAGFNEGWEEARAKLPDDPETKLFAALALMATADMADKTLEKQKAAGAMAEEVLTEIPRHPGAHHYVIHAYDSPPLAEQALPVARSYGDVAPGNSHALHMSSHIFTRRGLWPESIDFNIRAAEAASDRMPDGSVSHHYMHALDYLAYAYLQTGDDAAAEKVLTDMQQLTPPYHDHAATAYTFAAVPARLALERQDWRAAAAVPLRWPEEVAWERYPHLLAIPVFAQAMGRVHAGRPEMAQRSIDQLERLRDMAADLDTAYDWATQVEILRLCAEGWLTQAKGEIRDAVKLMQQAAELEASTDKNPVTPGAVLPASELYADLLLQAGRFDEARQWYQATLAHAPNRFNSLFGAGLAAELGGDKEAATSFFTRLLEVAPSPTGERSQIAHARTAVQ